MKNWLKIIIVISLIINSFGMGFRAVAQISVYNMRVENIKDRYATLKWQTSEDVRSQIYYGLDATNLSIKLSYDNYKKNHEAILYGLEEDQNYYYRVDLYAQNGEKLSLYTRSFSTDNMIDTKAPRFVDLEVLQASGNSVAISWKANEKVSAEIQYYKDGQSDNKKTKKVSGYKEENQVFIYDLDTYNQYYIRVTLKDKAGNKKSDTVAVNIYDQFNKDTELQIKNVEPLSTASDLVGTNQATIKFKTNLAAKSYIKYGSNTNQLNKKITINDKLSTSHQITINDLEPGTTYYYNIYVNGSFYNKKSELKGLSFTTGGSVLGVKEEAENIDSDYDQLSNALEMVLGTNPNDPDTDNDGYRDGTEVMNGYNPLGSGKWDSPIQFFYGKPRLDLEYEKSKALELKKAVDKKLPYIYIDSNKWQMLSNAYVYGDYPIDAIIMYIKLDGKTVHPEIDWNSWKNSPDYKKYEKYIK